MSRRTVVMQVSVSVACLLASNANGGLDSIGPNGINGLGLRLPSGVTLTGNEIAIGMSEEGVVADPDFPDPEEGFFGHPGVDLAGVYEVDDEENGSTLYGLDAASQHAIGVAGVIISTDMRDPDGPSQPLLAPRGVAPMADLHASAFFSLASLEDIKLSMQHAATRNGGDVRAVNLSFGVDTTPSMSPMPTGNSQLSLFLDWSAQSDVHDVLYVGAAAETGGTSMFEFSDDNFNGITVGASRRDDSGVFNVIDEDNRYLGDLNRTFVDILAPGRDILTTQMDDMVDERSGTSFAAPHVTGTVALLQELADFQIDTSAPRWDADARRHEVMKTVLMNSADKFIDDGSVNYPGTSSPIPAGYLGGMERTVIKQKDMPSDPDETYFDSIAFGDDQIGFGPDTIPLDEQMGTGHLNARRAHKQFRNGEFDGGGSDVPVTGWDYGTTAGDNEFVRYRFDEELKGGSFISITLAWDRHVAFAPGGDGGMTGKYDTDDMFAEYTEPGDIFGDPQADDVINDLDIYLLPRFAGDINDAVAAATSFTGTVEHLFVEVPSTGFYEFWVLQEDEEAFSVTQDYGVAWWGIGDVILLAGDFDGDGNVNGVDLAQWEGDFGVNGDSDATDDGVSSGADFLAWQRAFGTTSASSVPEPSATLLLAVFALFSIPLFRVHDAREN